jgi:transposase
MEAEASSRTRDAGLPKSHGDRRRLFVQAAWVVLIKPQSWERHGLKPWIEAAKKWLHHNVLAIALTNKLARIAWSVLARGGGFEASKLQVA